MLPPLPRRTARTSSRGGFTLVELLVVIGIIAILAGVALGPITNGIKQSQHNTSMQTGRQIGQMCFSSFTDNNQTYPAGANGFNIANSLINANYASDPSVFFVSGQDSGTMFAYTMPAGGVAAMTVNSCSWSFTTLGASTGVTSSASDLTPLVYFDNGPGASIIGTTFAGNAPTAVPTSTLQGVAPFGTDGVSVFYKGNNAAYLKATSSVVSNFISANDTDTTSYTVAK